MSLGAEPCVTQHGKRPMIRSRSVPSGSASRHAPGGAAAAPVSRGATIVGNFSRSPSSTSSRRFARTETQVVPEAPTVGSDVTLLGQRPVRRHLRTLLPRSSSCRCCSCRAPRGTYEWCCYLYLSKRPFGRSTTAVSDPASRVSEPTEKLRVRACQDAEVLRPACQATICPRRGRRGPVRRSVLDRRRSPRPRGRAARIVRTPPGAGSFSSAPLALVQLLVSGCNVGPSTLARTATPPGTTSRSTLLGSRAEGPEAPGPPCGPADGRARTARSSSSTSSVSPSKRRRGHTWPSGRSKAGASSLQGLPRRAGPKELWGKSTTRATPSGEE